MQQWINLPFLSMYVNYKKPMKQKLKKLIKSYKKGCCKCRKILKHSSYKCLDSKNKVLEEEILLQQAQTEEVTGTTEELKWKMFKLKLIKEFETEHNEGVNKVIRENNVTSNPPPLEFMETRQNLNTETKTKGREIIEKIAQLKEEIETQKRAIQMTDPKLLINTKMLEKRNVALLTRYQRQLSEATARYRQTQSEVSSLRRMLADTVLKKGKE
jgi:hypothetical protein